MYVCVFVYALVACVLNYLLINLRLIDVQIFINRLNGLVIDLDRLSHRFMELYITFLGDYGVKFCSLLIMHFV